MKLVVWSDLHMHPFKNGFITEEGKNSRVQDAVNVINRVYTHASKCACSYVIFAGDFFDKRRSVNTHCYNEGHKVVTESSMNMGIQSLLLHGNHDQFNRSGTIHSLERFHTDNCYVFDTPEWYKLGESLGLYAVPYIDDMEQVAVEVTRGLEERPTWATESVLLLHAGVQGAKVGPSDYVLPCELELPMLQPDRWDLILSGHYHISQQLGDRFHYIGSAMQHRWDDAGFEKTFMVIDTDDWSIERIPTNAPEFLVVKGKTKDYEVENCFVKIVRDYEIEPEKKERVRQKLLDRGALSVIFDFVPVKSNKDCPERIEFSEDKGAYGIIEDYIESDLVGIGDLDQDKLITIGKGILEQASA